MQHPPLPHAHAQRAYRLYLWLTGANAFFSAMYFVIAAVYRVRVAHLNPLQLVLVGTVMELSIFVFQVPTGVIADVVSRRASIIIGFALMGAGLTIEPLFPRFDVILGVQVLWGLGYTFTSGATEAWIAGEVEEGAAGNTFVRGAQVVAAAGLIGSPLGALLAGVRLNLGMLIAGIATLGIAAALIPLMPESGFRGMPDVGADTERPSFRRMAATAREGVRLVRLRPALASILAVGLFFGLYSEAYDRLQEAHFLADLSFPPLGHLSYMVWFGVIDAGASLLALGATEVVRRRVDLASHRAIGRALVGMTAMLSLGVIVFGLAGSFWLAVAAVWTIAVMRRASSPLYDAWLTMHADPKVRATVISLAGQVDAFGQVAGGPALGALATLRGLRVALVAAGALLTPAIPLLWRATQRAPVYPVTSDVASTPESADAVEAVGKPLTEHP